MNFSNAAYDLADQRAEQEREAAVLAARLALGGDGSSHCIECGDPIESARRAAYPSARRCVACQSAHELEHARR